MEHTRTLEGGEQHSINPVDQWQAASTDHINPTERTIRHLSRVTFRPLAEYEPPLLSEPPPEPPEIPSAADFPNLPRFDAFQLALDLSWAREHRIEEPEQRITPADVQATRWLLHTVVEVLDRRRPLVQLRHQLDARVFAAMETRLRIPAQRAAAIHLRSMHAWQPAKGVIEACGLLDHGRQIRALAARLEVRRRGWLCTVLRVL